jgi:hypothetical protein
MCARTGQRPIENPKEDDETQPKPAVDWNSGFFIFESFDLRLGGHTPSVHRKNECFRIELIWKEKLLPKHPDGRQNSITDLQAVLSEFDPEKPEYRLVSKP